MAKSSVPANVSDQERGETAGNASGFVLAGSASNSGKTLLSLGLIRALRDRGLTIGAAKCGPDYIDPRFLAAAAGCPAINLDPWAMSRDRHVGLAQAAMAQCDILVIEGVMGLFDGATGQRGSTDDLASTLGFPVILAIPADGTAQSTAAIATGFAALACKPGIAGSIVTRTASERHEDLIREGFERIDVPLLGFVRRSPDLTLKSRHLGLVQAEEIDALDSLIARAASAIVSGVDLDAVLELVAPVQSSGSQGERDNGELKPLGQRIAIARDVAFAFAYPHMLADWQAAGAELSFFSPLADEAPSEDCDAIFLPGGYPELHAGNLAGNKGFLAGLKQAAKNSVLIYGECGGYMVLGDRLIDAEGASHRMAELLPLRTSFAERKLHLGYRQLTPKNQKPWPKELSGHEFHYASIVDEDLTRATPLFASADAAGQPLGDIGLVRGSVMGSFAHVIDAYRPD